MHDCMGLGDTLIRIIWPVHIPRMISRSTYLNYLDLPASVPILVGASELGYTSMPCFLWRPGPSLDV